MLVGGVIVKPAQLRNMTTDRRCPLFVKMPLDLPSAQLNVVSRIHEDESRQH
jgi:hypothetical protein